MRKGLIYIILTMTVVLVIAVLAQEGAAESDPFYPSAGRPGALVPPPSPSGDNTWGRDPFNNPLAGRVPVQTGTPAPGAVRMLTGIIYSPDVRLAIINGDTYHVGNMFGDRKLVDIRERSVVLKSEAGDREEMFLEDFTMSK